MRGTILIAVSLMFGAFSFGANLNVDATKKVKPKIIQPSKQKTKLAPGLQNKRFRTKVLDRNRLLHGDSQISVSSRSAGETMSSSQGERASIVNKESKRTTQILEQTVTSSDAFEKAYRDALKIELTKRAAAQVEIRKNKKKASQGDINKDAKARREQTEGFKVQKAGAGK